MEGGREGGRDGGKEGGRDGGREGGRDGRDGKGGGEEETRTRVIKTVPTYREFESVLSSSPCCVLEWWPVSARSGSAE